MIARGIDTNGVWRWIESGRWFCASGRPSRVSALVIHDNIMIAALGWDSSSEYTSASVAGANFSPETSFTPISRRSRSRSVPISLNLAVR